jgi:hypothetical protein
MSDDACDRARRAIGELCGMDPVEDDSNTFYVQTVHTQGRRVGPRDTNEIAQAAEDAAAEIDMTLALRDDNSTETQTITPSPNRIETYFKVNVQSMTPSEVELVMDSIESNMGSGDITRGRGFDDIRLVDRSFVFGSVPEMVRPPRQDAEVR